MRACFKNHIDFVVGSVPIAKLTAQDVYRTLQPIWQTTTDTGKNCRSCLFQLFRWARARGWCTGDNPADSHGVLAVYLEPLRPRAVRLDSEQNDLSRSLTKQLGTTPADALRMFVYAFNAAGGFPYSVRVNSKNPVEPFESEQEAIDFTTRMTDNLHQKVDSDEAR